MNEPLISRGNRRSNRFLKVGLAMSNVIETHNLTKYYGRNRVVDSVNVEDAVVGGDGRNGGVRELNL